MTVITFTSKQALIDALEDRRKWAQRKDAEAAKAHRAEERAALKDAHDKARKVLALKTYPALKDYMSDRHGYRRAEVLRIELPACPRSVEEQIDRTIARLALTGQQLFTIDSQGRWRDVHHLLTAEADEAAHREVCA